VCARCNGDGRSLLAGAADRRGADLAAPSLGDGRGVVPARLCVVALGARSGAALGCERRG
jgi:hypothetical protein